MCIRCEVIFFANDMIMTADNHEAILSQYLSFLVYILSLVCMVSLKN